jgi:co-chaperonin GroES (HSP10)
MKDQSNVGEQFTATVTRAKPELPDLNMVPMPGVILGQPIRVDKTEGGVVIPESAQEQNIPRVLILHVGTGVDSIQRGDIVHYAPYTSQVPFLSINGIKVVRLFIDEIIGKEKNNV